MVNIYFVVEESENPGTYTPLYYINTLLCTSDKTSAKKFLKKCKEKRNN